MFNTDTLLILIASSIAHGRNEQPHLTRSQDTASPRTRVAVCGAGKCRGALWRPQWVVTSVECVQRLPVVVYHLHDEQFECSGASRAPDEERRDVDRVYKLKEYSKPDSITLLHLATPYTNITIPFNDTLEFFILETLLKVAFEEQKFSPTVRQEADTKRNQTPQRPNKKPPMFNIFATTLLLPLSCFLVLYLLLSFFSRNDPSAVKPASGYNLFGKHGYEDTNV